MNVAILIGISEYEYQSNLPACKNDVRLMNLLIEKTGKYKEVLFIDKDTNSKSVKDKIIDFLDRIHKSEEDIEEVFFYFSGHGTYDNKEFYYVMSDFQHEHKKRTSLENAELDNLLRNLDANLVVKMVDACESGVTYVKDIDNNHFDKILNYRDKVFQKCYFMFSSRNNQKSYAGDELSSFTDGIFSAILESDDNKNIRYKEIIDSISDSFAKASKFNGQDQEPFFISQATYKEEFCLVTSEIKNSLEEAITHLLENPEASSIKNTSIDFVKIIEEDARKYCKSLSEIEEQVLKLKDYIAEYTLGPELEQVYKLKKYYYERTLDIPEIDAIASILEDHGYKNDYYVDVYYSTKEVKEIASMTAITSIITGDKPKYRTVAKTVPDSYETTISLPFHLAQLKINTALPNLKSFDLKIVPIASRSKLLIFFSHNSYKEERFDEYVLVDDVEWRQIEVEIKNDELVRKSVHTILDEMKNRILGFISKKFGINVGSLDVTEEKSEHTEIIVESTI